MPPLGDKGHAYARRRRWCNGSLQCRRKNELMGVGVAVPLGWREEQARWARGDQPGACGSGDQRRPRGYVVRDLIPPVACTCSWKLVAGLYCRGVSRPGRAALSLWTHCGNEPRRVVWREHLHHVNKPGRHLVFCVIERITLVHTCPLGAWVRRTRRGAPSGPSRDASRRTLRSLARCSKQAVSAFR